ncbi:MULTISPECIES: hypothetical protein [unclassified Mycobacterium]|nr:MULTISPECIES: hypothetical protein [unclassified Mycobacterium]SEA34817.1 hypothetical protein SAMN04488580_102428 [Mycobacterium sp. 283mftsu]
MADEVLIERQDRAVVVMINDPDSRNAVISGAGGNNCAGVHFNLTERVT